MIISKNKFGVVVEYRGRIVMARTLSKAFKYMFEG